MNEPIIDQPIPIPLAFIGGGNMAEAILRAGLEHGVITPERVLVADPEAARQEALGKLGVAVYGEAAAMVEDAGDEAHVVFAVKPQVFDAVAASVAKALGGQVLISIMAGVTTQRIVRTIGRPMRVVRVMPNTPLMVGLGMAGVAVNEHCDEDDATLAMVLFSTGQSRAVRVEERDLDAITAVSGSGPAYVYYLAEAMQAAAKKMGLGDQAEVLVNQTILGAARMLLDAQGTDGGTAAELRKKVMSPGGTTEAAITFLEAHNVDLTIAEALERARQRSEELSKPTEPESGTRKGQASK